ncbi:MAG: hypothetical protein LAN64_10730 [Acidobacteriia bacterium]|nr:hypothetical protein [Terriglobia bacterium]
MKRIPVLVCAVASLFCWFAGAMMWAQSVQPSLPDVARQKPTAKATRVVTNDEIPPSPLADNPATSSSAASAAAAGSGTKPAVHKDADKGTASAEKPTKLQELMNENESLEKIIKQMQEKIDATNDQDRIAALSDVMKHTMELLAENRQEIDALKASDAASGQSAAAQPPTVLPATSAQGPPK